jgi:hypothetical protein
MPAYNTSEIARGTTNRLALNAGYKIGHDVEEKNVSGPGLFS